MYPELLLRSVAETEGPADWFLNSLNIVKATTESTGGAFSIVHHTAPPGHATPYHLHRIKDEAFYVLDGEFTFLGDGKKTILGPGGYIFLPRNIPHGIRCTGSDPSTMLILAMPGTGFVGMMIEMAELLAGSREWCASPSRGCPPPGREHVKTGVQTRRESCWSADQFQAAELMSCP